MIDSTSVRAYQQAATGGNGSADHCLGRSRGGLTAKTRAVVRVEGVPIRLDLTAGRTHDGRIADTLLDHLSPRIIVLADKAYDVDSNREMIRIRAPHPISRPNAIASVSPPSASCSIESTT